MSYRICFWSEKEFSQAQSSWADLLARSDSDPLFMSWPWQFSWWSTWSQRENLDLVMIVVLEDEKLVAILPLYRGQSKVDGFFSVSRLQFIGGIWQGTPTVRTEYLSPIIDRDQKQCLIASLVDFVFENLTWQDFIITDIYHGSDGWLFFHSLKERCLSSVLEKVEASYRISPMAKNFKEYLGSLGKNSRLQMFNRRSYLERKGKFPKIKECNPEIFFGHLNSFHRIRWGKACFNNEALDFHKKLIQLSQSDNLSVWLTVLEIDGDVISAGYDIDVGNQVYNIQQGFIEYYDPKVSLGTMHLGFNIERAFLMSRSAYDFLAGYGKNADYKSRISNSKIDLVSYRLVRSWRQLLIARLKSLMPKSSYPIIKRILGHLGISKS